MQRMEEGFEALDVISLANSDDNVIWSYDKLHYYTGKLLQYSRRTCWRAEEDV